MAKHALAALESALRERKLDRTLTSKLSPLGQDDVIVVPTGIGALDACLQGGVPRGQLSELTGPQSSGRTTLLLQMIAAVTRRGEIAALIDTFDRLDVGSAAAAGIDFDRLLWVRGDALSVGRSAGSLLERTLDRALKALNLVLQSGGFACVTLDVADVPLSALKRIPFTTWLRIQRIIEGSDTACVLVAPQPLARSAGGLTLSLTGHSRWGGDDGRRHLTGADLAVRVVSPRRRIDGEARIASFSNFH